MRSIIQYAFEFKTDLKLFLEDHIKTFRYCSENANLLLRARCIPIFHSRYDQLNFPSLSKGMLQLSPFLPADYAGRKIEEKNAQMFSIY